MAWNHIFPLCLLPEAYGREFMAKMDPPKLPPSRPPKLTNKDHPPPVTHFTAKYGLLMKNSDHLPQMKKRWPLNIPGVSFAKFEPMAYLRGFLGFLEIRCASSCSSTQCTVASFLVKMYAAYIVRFLWTLHKATEAYWWKPVIQNMPLWTSLMSLVVSSRPLTCTDLSSCGWPTMGTNFSQ